VGKSADQKLDLAKRVDRSAVATRLPFPRPLELRVGTAHATALGHGSLFGEFHRQYNAATDDLKKGFMKENNIVDEYDLTPDHARAVLKAIDESQDPRILTYRNFIRLFRLFPWLRSGRGTE
jgi:hypothetical protein